MSVIADDQQLDAVTAAIAQAAGDNPAVGAVLYALGTEHPDEPDERILARFVIEYLALRGWRLVPVEVPA
jgi:hypothetical protein